MQWQRLHFVSRSLFCDRCAGAYNDVITVWDRAFKSFPSDAAETERDVHFIFDLPKCRYIVAHNWTSINWLLIRCFSTILTRSLFIYFFPHSSGLHFWQCVRRTPNPLTRPHWPKHKNKSNHDRHKRCTSPRSLGSCISIKRDKRKGATIVGGGGGGAWCGGSTCVWRLNDNHTTIPPKLYVWICNFR